MGERCTQSWSPIERVKLLLQTQDGNAALLGRSHNFRGFTNCVARTVRDEGMLSLWRGNGTTVIRYYPFVALNFSLKQAPHRRPRHRVRPGRPQARMGRPGDAESAQVPTVADGRGVGDNAATRGARGVPLLLLPPRAAPPFPLLSIPLPAPRLHQHRAHYLCGGK